MEYRFINQLRDGQSVVLVTAFTIFPWYLMNVLYILYIKYITSDMALKSDLEDENLYLSKDILRLLSFFVNVRSVKHRVYMCY